MTGVLSLCLQPSQTTAWYDEAVLEAFRCDARIPEFMKRCPSYRISPGFPQGRSDCRGSTRTELLCFGANAKDKAGFVVLLDKLEDYRGGLPQEGFDFLGGTVCRPQPNELGRLPLENTALLKV